MKNKEFYKLLKKNKFKPNSGFTLTELLVGLIMSTIVIAGLGWGLMQILRTTKTETSKIASRSETSRAFNFIADEVKAAQTIEVDMSSTNLSIKDDTSTPDINEEVAPDFELPDGGEVRLALRVPNVSQRIIYFVAPPKNSSPWKGPLVIYRWGPGLDSDGNYITDSTSASRVNNPTGWKNEALIDGVSNESLTASCDADGDGTAEDVSYKGFYACVVDDDGDGVTEDDATIDTNGDGVVDAKDGADTDGVSITAQLYFAAETEDAGVYKTDSQVVARARVAPLRKPGTRELTPVYFESLRPQYGRNINNDPDTPCWTVRNDFGQGSDPTALPDSDDPNRLQNTMTWIHEENRQPQPLNIDRSKPFTIVASAFGGLNPVCLARGNKYQRVWDDDTESYRFVDSNPDDDIEYTEDDTLKIPADGSEQIHTYEHKVWHTIDFSDPDTFNGNETSNADVDRSAAENSPAEGTVGAGEVRVYRNGDSVDDFLGYDADNTGDRDQDSIKQFLIDEGYVSDGKLVLEPNQRIISFEIGQDNEGTEKAPNPGFDLQDNIFLMTSDAFLSSNSDEYESEEGQ